MSAPHPHPPRLELRLPLSPTRKRGPGSIPRAARVGAGGAGGSSGSAAERHLALLVAVWVCRSGPLRLAAVHLRPALSPGLTESPV